VQPPYDPQSDDEDLRSERSSVVELSARELRRPQGSRFWTRRRLHAVDIAAGILVSSALGGLGMVVVDRIFRPEWDISWGDHWLGAPILFVCASVLVGLLWTLLVLSERAVASAFPYSSGRRDFVRVASHAVMAGMLCWSTAVWTFSGKAVSTTWLRQVGPALFVCGVMAFVILISWLGFRVDRQAARRRYSSALLLAFGYLGLSAAAFWADMNLYVSLYERLHTLLEVAAFGLLVAAFQAVGFVAMRRFPGLRLPTRALAGSLVTLAVVFVGYRPLRSYTDGLLSHAWVNQVYVGRTLKRAQMVELTLDGGHSLEMARVHHIAERYGLSRTKQDPSWLGPASEPSAAAQALRGGKKNIVFFYVDTLRYDVASDRSLMPNLAKFSEESLDFRAAYSPGSDTLRALPALTSGTYYTQEQSEGDLLRLAERADHESVFIGPLSATEFLERHRPQFKFERRAAIEDYEVGKDVWGYGADRPTAHSIVDAGIEVLNQKASGDPFLLWLFHFDQHAWRELDEGYIKARQSAYGYVTEGSIDVRYRVVAHAIDEEFGRFLAALDASGHRDDTVVVFVSDHGEGLGRDGFWVHSVFLWEDLIHVPLLIRAPGVAPGIVETPVSLVDVAPTIAPYFGLEQAPVIYHGVDLLEFALGNKPERKFPILLRGANADRLERIGIIEPKSGRKLIMSLEAALPELYAVPSDRRDARNLARQEPAVVKRLLTELARSPVFPRSMEDFDLLLDRGAIGVDGVVAAFAPPVPAGVAARLVALPAPRPAELAPVVEEPALPPGDAPAAGSSASPIDAPSSAAPPSTDPPSTDPPSTEPPSDSPPTALPEETSPASP